MADYHSILNRAIDGLEENSEETRRTIYDKARNALMRQLSSLEPALSPAEISKQRLQLEEAIRDTENQFTPPSNEEETGEEEALQEVEAVAAPAKPASDEAPVQVEEGLPPSQKSSEAEALELQKENNLDKEDATVNADITISDNKEKSPDNLEPIVEKETQPSNSSSSPEPVVEVPTAPTLKAKDAEPEVIAEAETVTPHIEGQIEVTAPTLEQKETTPPQAALSEKSQKLLEEADASLARVDALRAEKTNPLDELKETLENEGVLVEKTNTKAPEVTLPVFEEQKNGKTEFDEEPEVNIDDAMLVEKASRKAGNKSLFWIIFLLILIGAATFLWAQREQLKTPFIDNINKGVSSLINAITPENNETSQASSSPLQESDEGVGNKAQDRLLDTPLEEEPDTSFDENVSLPNVNETPGINFSENTAPPVEATSVEEQPQTPPAAIIADETSNEDTATDVVSAPETNETSAATQTSTTNIFTASAILYEERRDTGRPDVSTGNVTWELDPTGSAAIGSDNLPSIKGNARIQNRDLRVRFEIMRNLDASLPASHLIEIEFEAGPLFADDTINNIAGVLMKEREQDNGQQIAGAIVKVSENIFWVAMSSQAADQASNTDALKSLKWYDIPVVFASGKRAILTLEKGAAGQKATEGAFEAWEKQAQ